MAMLVPAANREKGSMRYLVIVQRSVLQNIAGYYKILQDIIEYFRILQNFVRYFRILQDIIKYWRTWKGIIQSLGGTKTFFLNFALLQTLFLEEKNVRFHKVHVNLNNWNFLIKNSTKIGIFCISFSHRQMSRSNRSINQNTWHLRQNCFVSNLKRPDCWTPDLMGPASS